MADSNHAVIIVKKKKHGEHGHHGGAWKVAYADFVTAMMAFFLLLWLLNVTTDEQKRGISQYFTPESVSRSTSGSGGVLGGKSLSPGSMPSSTASTVVAVAVPVPSVTSREQDDPDEDSVEEAAAKKEQEQAEKARDPSETPQKPRDATEQEGYAGQGKSTTPREATAEEMSKALDEREEQQFKRVEQELRERIERVTELRALSQNLLIDRTEEGLRIQIVDQAKVPMFPLGSAAPYDYAKKLLTLVTQVVQSMPNQIAVTGHTDANPFSRNNGYSNWELSADRANSTRRAMLDAGLPAARFARIVGKADREPLLANDPLDPTNRRISIVLLHDKNPAGSP
jgi:chemotaxis protein MotB